jgi:outer membrane putative beta-barrel porin/alpha-amylase
MKKKYATLLFSLFVLVSIGTNAQKETKKFSVGIGLEAGLPTGSESKYYGGAFGGTLRFSYHAGPGFIALTSGVLAYLPKSSSKNSVVTYSGYQIPIRAGYKYIFLHHFFAMGETGYSIFNSFERDTETHTNIRTVSGSVVAAVSAGIQFGFFEAGVRYGFNVSRTEGLLGARIGFNF